MADRTRTEDSVGEIFAEMMRQQADMAQQLFGQFLPAAHVPASAAAADKPSPAVAAAASVLPSPADAEHWAEVAQRLQGMWLEFQAEQAARAASPAKPFGDPAQWMAMLDGCD